MSVLAPIYVAQVRPVDSLVFHPSYVFSGLFAPSTGTNEPILSHSTTAFAPRTASTSFTVSAPEPGQVTPVRLHLHSELDRDTREFNVCVFDSSGLQLSSDQIEVNQRPVVLFPHDHDVSFMLTIKPRVTRGTYTIVATNSHSNTLTMIVQ